MSSEKFLALWHVFPNASFGKERIKKMVCLVLCFFNLITIFFTLAYLLFFLKRDWRKILPMLMVIAYITLVAMIMIGRRRFRLPVDPFLIIMSSYMIIYIICSIFKRIRTK